MPHTSDRKFLEEEVDRLRRRVAELEQQQGQGEVFGTTVNNATEGMPSGNVLSELELHVEQRTTELAKANRKLNEEIEVRKQIAQNLKLSAEIMHNMAEGVCLLRASDGVLVFTNPRFDEIFGYEPGELNGRHTGILNAPGDDTPNEVAEKILQDLQETGNWSGEVQNICKDGTKLWTHSSVSTFEHSQYGMVRVAVVEDITDRKLAEQVAHEKETQLENLLLNVDAIILEGDPFDIYFVGGQVERILGYPKEEWFEHPEGPVGFWSERLHLDDVDKIETCIRAIERGEDHAFEYRLISKDGTSVWFYDSVMVETRDGKPVRTRSVMIDVTARKQAEEALRESEQRFRRVFEDGPIGMALVGVDFQIMEVNPALCQMLGYTAAELLLIDIADITHPDDFAKDLALAEQLVSGAIPMYQLEKRYIKKNGDEVWGYLTASLIRDADGTSCYGVCIVEDITKRKHAEEEARNQRNELAHVSRISTMGEMATGIAHELNQPLTPLHPTALPPRRSSTVSAPALTRFRKSSAS
jgi:PAS domain S-box-containing protein